jgi:hypothetical protein
MEETRDGREKRAEVPGSKSQKDREMDSPDAQNAMEVVQMEQDEDSKEGRVEVVDSGNVDGELDGDQPIQAEKVEEQEEPAEDKQAEEEEGTEKDTKTETGGEKLQPKQDEELPEPGKQKSGVPMAGLAITALGALGVAGAIVLDPVMNMVDSSHPATMAIGMMQMIGIAVAAVVLVAGILVSMKRKK